MANLHRILGIIAGSPRRSGVVSNRRHLLDTYQNTADFL